MISIDTMEIRQINLKLPENFVKAAEDYAKKFGFKNIQELAASSMREKIFAKREMNENMIPALMSEQALAKDWLTKEEDEAWKDL